MADQPGLFRNVHERDHLGFWADQTLKAREVAEFLQLKKPDVARVAGVATASVRFDHKIPREVHERLEEIANICALVAEFFEGDVAKTALWFRTRNPMLGDIAPRDMIRFGRYSKLQQFVLDALNQNPEVDAVTGGEAGERNSSVKRRAAEKATAAG